MSESTDRPGTAGNEAFLRQRRFARECALQFLFQVDLSTDSSRTSEERAAFWEQIEGSDNCLPPTELAEAKAFADRLIHGVLTTRDALDARLAQCARNWSVERMSTIDRNILRLAAFEVTSCTDIPALASIDEAIELAKEFGDKDSPRFVNGVLDKLYADRQQAAAEPPPQASTTTEPTGTP